MCDDGVEAMLAQRKTFSSHVFKVEIQNLPPYFSVKQMKKMIFAKHNVAFHRIKPCPPRPGKQHAYVNFVSASDRDAAINVLDGLQLRGRQLKVFAVNAPPDPMLDTKKAKVQNESNQTLNERLIAAVCPLFADVSNYVAQVDFKQRQSQKLMSNLSSDITKLVLSASPVQVSTIKRSPVVDGYRNKCEFSVGINPETQAVCVGFRVASYKAGSIDVGPVDNIPIVSDEMKDIVNQFQSFVAASGIPPYNPISQSGLWRTLVVRQNKVGQLMTNIIINADHMPEAEHQESLINNLRTALAANKRVESCFVEFQLHQRTKEQSGRRRLIFGQSYLTETLCVSGKQLAFNVSPTSFFQSNSQGAEILYDTIAELINIDPADSVILDVCCGTGTIGLALAHQCLHVFGIELNADAVADAKQNATANGISNVTFINADAEAAIRSALEQCASLPGAKRIAIILDPPRAGLTSKTVRHLVHACHVSPLAVGSIVYVSCNSEAARPNMVSLCRPPAKGTDGLFLPDLAVPVDMFPHTKHIEMVVHFRRQTNVPDCAQTCNDP